ncbi:PREDICTED: pregnancy-specific beta-1-glycoprotein 3-like [Cyprinodon variegatus]|nr:PREDICTED: pregnancy-specific beta-1-glycoprotein 3-like [Cyprinodon variegatus]
MQKPDDSQYKWFQNGNQINETGINLKKKIVEMKKVQFSCEVYNKISNERSDPVVNMCFEPVRKPEINTTCKSSEVFFTCNAAQQADDAQYKWFQNGEVIHNEIKISLIRTISESKNMNFSCEVYNDGSSEKSLSLSHNCVYNILPGIPDELFGISTWIFIAGGGGFLLVLIIIIVCCCVICKKKKKLRENDEEELEYRGAKRSTSSYCSP